MTNHSPSSPFTKVLAALLEPDSLLSPSHLSHLSSLHAEDAAELARSWEAIPLERRRSLVIDMAAFAVEDPLLFFEEVGKIAITDPDPQVRLGAIRLTELEEDPAFSADLIDLLEKDPHFEVRAAAASSLGKYVYLGEIEDIPASALKRVEDALFKAHKEDQQTLVRRRALEAISFSSRPDVSHLIEDAYSSSDEDWQISAVFAMGASANDRWEAQVAETLETESALLRREAVRAAGKLALKNLKPDLFAIAEHDSDEDVRIAAVWALTDIGGLDVSGFLEERLAEAENDEQADFYEEAMDNFLETQMFDEMDLPLFDFDEDALKKLNDVDLDEEGDD